MRLKARAISQCAAKVGGLAVLVFVGIGISPDAAGGVANASARIRRWYAVAGGAAMAAILLAVAAATTS